MVIDIDSRSAVYDIHSPRTQDLTGHKRGRSCLDAAVKPLHLQRHRLKPHGTGGPPRFGRSVNPNWGTHGTPIARQESLDFQTKLCNVIPGAGDWSLARLAWQRTKFVVQLAQFFENDHCAVRCHLRGPYLHLQDHVLSAERTDIVRTRGQVAVERRPIVECGGARPALQHGAGQLWVTTPRTIGKNLRVNAFQVGQVFGQQIPNVDAVRDPVHEHVFP